VKITMWEISTGCSMSALQPRGKRGHRPRPRVRETLANNEMTLSGSSNLEVVDAYEDSLWSDGESCHLSEFIFTSWQPATRRLTHTHTHTHVVVWRTGSAFAALVSINQVNPRRARLVLGWVTVSGFNFNSQWETFISVCNQPPRSTQPGHPFVGSCNEYQPKGGDALWLGSKGRYGLCVGGR